MNIQLVLNKMSRASILIASFMVSSVSFSHGGGYHGHGGGGDYDRGGSRYHGHDGYYRGRGGYWGGWYGPTVEINVPFGGYYPYYPGPVCEMTRRCYPNGECVETEICN